MSYKDMCKEYGQDLMDLVVQFSTIGGRAAWKQGRVHWELEKAIRQEYEYKVPEWLATPVLEGSHLTSHKFDKNTFAGLTWGDVWRQPAYFLHCKEYGHLARILRLHGLNLPPLEEIEDLGEPAMTPMEVGGESWAYLLDRKITKLSQFCKKIKADGTIDVSGIKDMQSVATWLSAVGVTTVSMASGRRQALYCPTYAKQNPNLLTTPIPYLKGMGELVDDIDRMICGTKTLKEWAAKGYPVPLFLERKERTYLIKLAGRLEGFLEDDKK